MALAPLPAADHEAAKRVNEAADSWVMRQGLLF
jgi:hypothetical protein